MQAYAKALSEKLRQKLALKATAEVAVRRRGVSAIDGGSEDDEDEDAVGAMTWTGILCTVAK
jgi:hypothetical protein